MILPLADLEPIGPFATPRPSMRGRYLIRNRPKALAMRLVDAVLSLVPLRRRAMPVRPERILVANWAHLGDVTTAIGPLRALRQRYPDARIDMLVGSWGRAAIAGTGLVDTIHIVDHWMANRADLPAAAKRARYAETRKAALIAMRDADYQIGIDLYPFFPPAHPLFLAARIPVRIGYTSTGFGSLLTHPVRWSDAERPMADQYRDLLDRIDPSHPFDPAMLRPRRDRGTLVPLLPAVAALRRYIVIHPGAGSPSRHWGGDRWQAVIARLRTEAPQHAIVLTGAGASDSTLAEELAGSDPGIVTMAGCADWEQFVTILAHADLVVCPDTVTGHVAALFDTPVVVIFTGTNSPAKWAPYGNDVRVLVRPVVCAPCNRTGCDTMMCFRGVEPDAVADAALAALGDQRSG